MELLPLFPLGTVLLPGARLPLLVFEPRYVALLEDLAQHPAGHGSFGVVAIRQGQEVGADAATELHGTGCEALIQEPVHGVEPPFHLLARGARRFRLDGIDESAGTPYLTGRVTWLDEPGEGSDATDALARLAAAVRAAHASYATALGAPPAALPAGPDGELAYRVVERSALPLGDRQRILEAPSGADRLGVVLRTLRRETALLSQVRAVPGLPDVGHSSPN